MILVGMLDSPYVRRVAISAQFLGIKYTVKPLSVFDNYKELKKINPLAKAPSVILDDGSLLIDSSLIIDYMMRISTNKYLLMPKDDSQYRNALYLTGVALVATEKLVQVTYETMRRPKDKIYQQWLDRVLEQMLTAFDQLEIAIRNDVKWFYNQRPTQADITVAVAWRIAYEMLKEHIPIERYPKLIQFSQHAENLPEFSACPIEPQ
ncbi:MAG: glutathione S-transferase [Kordiimonadaceae bacterium]|jgi:glutathione S-transferase|nr:glutathione S-transferase [Kordiimonadaceae bacterium]MBT6032986.1 glutathione S-transferase [Kordiimonadaceae bacterium]